MYVLVLPKLTMQSSIIVVLSKPVGWPLGQCFSQYAKTNITLKVLVRILFPLSETHYAGQGPHCAP